LTDVAFPELGPEAMMRLEVVDLPLVVINDSKGGTSTKRLQESIGHKISSNKVLTAHFK
jgi:tartrate dehydratase beta subunit/fumarate hydratase class I family protein